MTHAARWARVGVALAMVSCAGIAYAHSNGVTGASGKQGPICNSCHNGGSPPKVTLTGPTALDAGSIATYTFQIQTDAAITGMNAAISDGKLAGNDAGFTVTSFDEITHARTLRPDGGAAVYTFSMTAPEFGGKITLFAAGNAANNNGQSDGDQASGTLLDIEVNGPPRPPPPEAGPPPTPTSTGTTPPPQVDSGPVAYDAGDDLGGAAAPADDSGCSVGWSDRSGAPAGALFGALVGLAALVRARRR